MKIIWKIAFVVFIFAQAVEARKVTIVSDGQIKLVNPTAATVSYSITCKDKTGTTTIATTAESLASGQSKSYGVQQGVSACVATHMSSGNSYSYAVTADTTGYLAGMAKCQKTAAMYVNVNAAQELCNSGYKLCTLQEFHERKGSASNLAGVVSASTFSSTYDSGTTWVNRSVANDEYAYVTDMYAGTYKCATGSNGSGSVINGCESRNGAMTVEKAYCCPEIVVEQCSVEISSSTSHLQSPQFKGGAPF